MENKDTEKHVFKATERGEVILYMYAIHCILFIVAFLYCLYRCVSSYTSTFLLLSLALGFVSIAAIQKLFSAKKAYRKAVDTEVEIDPVRAHFVYTYKGQTIEFDGKDVKKWYYNEELKVRGRLSGTRERDIMMILHDGHIIYMEHAWLWDGDYSWLHAGSTAEHNLKNYLETHREQLNLPQSESALTYGDMSNH